MAGHDAGAPLYLIDLHRSQVRNKVPRRWRNKDVGGLYYSTAPLDLTHRDLLRAYLPVGSSVDRQIHASRSKVREYMRTDVESITPDVDLDRAAQLLREHKYGCLPVVDGDNSLVGIITDADFLFLSEIVIEALADLSPETLAEIHARVDKARAEG